jgi:hypothetical protein
VKVGYVPKMAQRRVMVRGSRLCEGGMHGEQVRVDQVEVGEGAEYVYARMMGEPKSVSIRLRWGG